MPKISTEVEVDFDLEDYVDNIKNEYCKNNCLMCNPPSKLYEYIKEPDKSVILKYYPNKKTLEDIVNELNDLIKE